MSKNITLVSFGYSFGQPKYADLIIDAREFECAGKELRKKYTGLSKAYQNAMYGMNSFISMYGALKQKIDIFITKSENIDFVIAIGCHRGRHRSVAIIEKLSVELTGHKVSTQHIDINKKNSNKNRDISKNRDEKYLSKFDE